jgi:uncharacterized protein (DUF433 family)
MRLAETTATRLAAHARRRGESKSRVGERLIEEGLRMADHPGIVFRDGPAGRRAALAGGPDVWEVIDTLRGTGEQGERAIAATAEWGSLSPSQVRTAVRYYADHRAEVDEHIRRTREDAEREHEAWRRAQGALA